MNFSSFSNFEVKCPVPPIIFWLSKAYIGQRTEKKAVYPVAQWIPSWGILEYAEKNYRETVQFILKFLSMVYKECLIAAALGPLYRNLTISQCKRNKQRSLFYQASFLFSSTTGIEVPQITKEQVRTAISACQLGESPRDAVDQRSLIKKQ